MLEGLDRLADLRGVRTSKIYKRGDWKRLSGKGSSIIKKIYGNQTGKLITRLEQLQNGLSGDITEHAYGTIMARPGLSISDREIINIVILFIDDYESQLYSHIRGALRVGVKPNVILSVLSMAGRISSKQPSQVVEVVHQLARSLK